jgi:carbamoyl-phosphate synthase large subunit
MWTNKRVFISGGNGVIGRELVEMLHKQGAVIFVGDLKPFSADLPSNILYRQGDLNYVTPQEILGFKPEYFFHLAATFERSVETYEFWEENFWHNVKLSNHLMSIMKECPTLKRVIFASSYLIYEQSLYQFDKPQDEAYRLCESDGISPRNLTGMAKLMHEVELGFLHKFNQERFSVVTPRIFRVYGKGSRDVISRWSRMLLSGETINVYGQEGMFDYIYAGDVAEGLVRLAASSVQGAVNLGKDHARKVQDVIDVFKQCFPAMKTEFMVEPSEFEASQANMDRFYKQVGWKPAVEIEDGIQQLLEYERKIANKRESTKTISNNVLLTSASKKIPLLQALKKAMRKIGSPGQLIAADSDESCLARYFADDFWHMPPLTQLTDDRLIHELKVRRVQAVVPSRDGELAFWSARKEWLSQHGIQIMVSDLTAVDYCLDKLKFYEFCCKHDIPAIMTTGQLDKLDAETYVVKDRYGAGSQNMRMNLSWTEAQQHAVQLKYPIFQPYIKGREYSVDAYVDRNKSIKGLVCRSRDWTVNGESQVTTIVHDEGLEALCAEYIKKLQLYGHVVLQMILDDQQKIHLIECNSRFGGASTLGLAAGVDSFFWFLLEASGQDISQYPFIKTSRTLRQVRYPADIILDIEG